MIINNIDYIIPIVYFVYFYMLKRFYMDDYDFFDLDENEDVIEEEYKNPYLSDPKKCFKLILKLLPKMVLM